MAALASRMHTHTYLQIITIHGMYQWSETIFALHVGVCPYLQQRTHSIDSATLLIIAAAMRVRGVSLSKISGLPTLFCLLMPLFTPCQ